MLSREKVIANEYPLKYLVNNMIDNYFSYPNIYRKDVTLHNTAPHVAVKFQLAEYYCY